MVEDVNPTDNNPIQDNQTLDSANEKDANIEELKLEDADVEIDFESEFSEESSGDVEADGVADASDADSDTSDVAATKALDEQIVQLKLQLEDRNNQYLRLTADFENFRKRTSREKEELELQIKCNTISNLLEVVDNFERARAQIKPQNDGEMAVHKSYQSVYKQLVEGLKRVGVAPCGPKGRSLIQICMRQ